MFCHGCGSVVQCEDNYCRHCGVQQRIVTCSLICSSASTDEEELIGNYFHRGFSYKSILSMLMQYHDIHLSLRTLKRRIKDYGLRRRNIILSADEMNRAEAAIRTEIRGPGALMGYRLMWHTLKLKYRIQIRRDSVRTFMKHVDPAAVEQRRSRRLHRRTYTALGPNYAWHCDGNDKLKRFGFGIHGCIDGYSRRVIWLRCSSSNKNSSVIARYYLDAVRELSGCPFSLRTDHGTENIATANLQCLFRGSIHGHTYGCSQGNQRIECWWSFLKKHRLQWWIDLFEDLEESGALLTGHTQQVDCMRFCFMNLVQTDLNHVKHFWNSHRIRRSHGAHCPGGIPDELFLLPSGNALNCLVPVPEDLCNRYTRLTAPHSICQDGEFEQQLRDICVGQGIALPHTWEDGVRLYLYLRNMLF